MNSHGSVVLQLFFQNNQRRYIGEYELSTYERGVKAEYVAGAFYLGGALGHAWCKRVGEHRFYLALLKFISVHEIQTIFHVYDDWKCYTTYPTTQGEFNSAANFQHSFGPWFVELRDQLLASLDGLSVYEQNDCELIHVLEAFLHLPKNNLIVSLTRSVIFVKSMDDPGNRH